MVATLALSFDPLHPGYFPLLLRWLRTADIQPWWESNTVWTEERFRATYFPRTVEGSQEASNPSTIKGFILVCDATPIGYFQYYRLCDFPVSWIPQRPTLSHAVAGMDCFIAASLYQRQKIYAQAIRLFITKEVFSTCEVCIVDPDTTHTQAIRAYEKAGFIRIQTCASEGVTLMQATRQDR